MPSRYNCSHCFDSGRMLLSLNPEDSKSVQNFTSAVGPGVIEHIKETYGQLKAIQPFAVTCPYCQGAQVKRAQEVSKRANIPAAFYEYTLDDFNWDIYGKDMETKRKAVEDFVEHFTVWQEANNGLYIYSTEKGSGKTMLASCICNTLMKKYSILTKFVSASELLNYANESKNNASKGGNDPIKQIKECQLLVIDDLGQNKTGEDWLNDVLFNLVDYRYQNRKLTIVTSNMKMDALPYDVRIIDRLGSMTFNVSIPNVCVRTKLADRDKHKFLKERGLA